jgi:cytochrome c-type biogenesis protein CcmF
LSEAIEGSKVTVGAPFYNRVGLPVGLLLLFLTGIGPLLAWRSSSFKSVRKNVVLPLIAALVTAVVVIVCGVRPWEIFTTSDQGSFYAFFAFVLGAMVVTAIGSEFMRGAGVISRHTGQSLFASVVQLTRRNTRRSGGYIVHRASILDRIGWSA